MRDRTPVSDRQRLHLFNCYWHEHKQVKSNLRSALRQVWQWGLVRLRVSKDLQIWQTLDPWENTWWHAYNPATGRSATREAETEILAWIDRCVADE